MKIIVYIEYKKTRIRVFIIKAIAKLLRIKLELAPLFCKDLGKEQY